MFTIVCRWFPNTKVVSIKCKGGDCWNYGECVVLDDNLLVKYSLGVNWVIISQL